MFCVSFTKCDFFVSRWTNLHLGGKGTEKSTLLSNGSVETDLQVVGETSLLWLAGEPHFPLNHQNSWMMNITCACDILPNVLPVLWMRTSDYGPEMFVAFCTELSITSHQKKISPLQFPYGLWKEIDGLSPVLKSQKQFDDDWVFQSSVLGGSKKIIHKNDPIRRNLETQMEVCTTHSVHLVTCQSTKKPTKQTKSRSPSSSKLQADSMFGRKNAPKYTLQKSTWNIWNMKIHQFWKRKSHLPNLCFCVNQVSAHPMTKNATSCVKKKSVWIRGEFLRGSIGDKCNDTSQNLNEFWWDIIKSIKYIYIDIYVCVCVSMCVDIIFGSEDKS